jgi:hypothetical protein
VVAIEPLDLIFYLCFLFFFYIIQYVINSSTIGQYKFTENTREFLLSKSRLKYFHTLDFGGIVKILTFFYNDDGEVRYATGNFLWLSEV